MNTVNGYSNLYEKRADRQPRRAQAIGMGGRMEFEAAKVAIDLRAAGFSATILSVCVPQHRKRSKRR